MSRGAEPGRLGIVSPSTSANIQAQSSLEVDHDAKRHDDSTGRPKTRLNPVGGDEGSLDPKCRRLCHSGPFVLQYPASCISSTNGVQSQRRKIQLFLLAQLPISLLQLGRSTSSKTGRTRIGRYPRSTLRSPRIAPSSWLPFLPAPRCLRSTTYRRGRCACRSRRP